MAPHCAKPFHMVAGGGVGGEAFEVAQDIIASHLLQAPEQVAGIVEHDAGVATLTDQIGDEVGHATIAFGKRSGVVVVTDLGVLEHVLQVGNQLTVGSGGDGGLMHVEGDRKSGGDAIEL